MLAGFLIVFALALATLLLVRSMVGHLRKVRYGPGPTAEETPAADPTADPTGDATGDATPDAGGPATSAADRSDRH